MRILKLLCIAFAVLTLASCSMFESKNNINSMPVEALYNNARVSLENADYKAAERAYKRLIARFPYGDYNQQAQIDLAYAEYKDNMPDEAYSTIDRFIATYPTYRHAPYAYYLRGLINYDRTGTFVQRLFGRSDHSRQNQVFRKKSFQDFSKLVRRYPNSAYAADARKRLTTLRNGMAQFEINVARYYFRTKSYVAAAHRAKYVLKHFQQSPQAADALAIEAHSYRNMGLDDLADKTVAILKQNFPDHPYLTDPDWPHAASTLRRMTPFINHHTDGND